MKLELINDDPEIEKKGDIYLITNIDGMLYDVRLTYQINGTKLYQALNIEMPFDMFDLKFEDDRLGDWDFIVNTIPKSIKKFYTKRVFFNDKFIGYFGKWAKVTNTGFELSAIITMNGGNAIKDSVGIPHTITAINMDYLP